MAGTLNPTTVDELLIQILKSMDAVGLIAAQRVCRKWNHIIEVDADLQQALFKIPTSTKRLVLYDGTDDLIERSIFRGMSYEEAVEHAAKQVAPRFWTFTPGTPIEVKVIVNPLLAKIFVHEPGHALLEVNAVVDLRSAAGPGRKLSGSSADNKAGSGHDLDGKHTGETFRVPGKGKGIGNSGGRHGRHGRHGKRGKGKGKLFLGERLDFAFPNVNNGEPTGININSIADVPGVDLVLRNSEGKQRYLCDGGSWEKMYLTSPPIHRAVIQMRYLDGPMRGDNFVSFDNRNGEPLTIGDVLHDLQRRTWNYKVAWVKIDGGDLWV